MPDEEVGSLLLKIFLSLAALSYALISLSKLEPERKLELF